MKKSALSVLVVTALTSASAMAAHSFTNDNGDSLTIDGRFEVRYQNKARNFDDTAGEYEARTDEFNSGSSRFGFKGVKQLENGWQGFGHAEWGYNSSSTANDIYSRLLYAGVEHEKWGKIAAGTKQWSTFYDVAWYTDLGRTYGSRGTGYYNLADWGIASGTGRAENSITYRNNVGGDWKYGFTYQTTRNDVALAGNATATLKNGMGASTSYSFENGLTLGLAYHQNELTDIENASNINDGDIQRIALLGANYSLGGFYVGATYSEGSNWEVNDNAEFYDSRGAELYTYYHFENGLRPTLNVNYLTSKDDNGNGYERQTIIPGLEYHFTKNTFLLWAEYQFDQGNDQYVQDHYDNRDNQFSAGIRYYF
ncbi:porin [Vibrio variabilis]|uniref:porin n=1 Tax=Vibrio variabilis TaxID=990271 RepID=UPI000DD56A0A|nr:porin [Vibrio variabilis]